ncbi:MAG: efflux RND transporter periplasmic adaptor subunit [Desulfuromonadales bacterium]|nr:efflux RND transporter periplasmic adaptor subunit [Desulfuromonadales bacterium]
MNIRKSARQWPGLLLILLLMLAGCDHAPHAPAESAENEAEPVVVTAYSAKSELFMEYDQPLAGEPVGFLVHLTRLADFKPVTAGALKLIFTPASGAPVEVVVPEPTRPGIYKTEAALPEPGNWRLSLVTTGSGFEDTISAPDVRVAAKGESLPHVETPGGGISYLKEQQWVVDFMVEPLTRRSLAAGFSVAGELVPAANAEATVAAPLAGTLAVSRPLPFVGQRVAKGELVALIEPPVSPQGGYAQLAADHGQAKSRLILAESEYERANQLVEAKIAPRKRLEEAQAAVASARAGFEPLERALTSVQGGETNRIALRAPLAGTVVDVSSGNGRGVAAGEAILRIVDPARLWLKASVPALEAGKIHAEVAAASRFTVAGLEGEFTPSRLVASGDLIDPHTRTMPVLFAVDNAQGLFKAGMYATVAIHTGRIDDALAVPKEALVEDEGRSFVFVQSSGEAFERREVKIGIQDAGFVQIVGGLVGDERVATRGAYYVKQAESAAKGGADQGHAH